MLHRQLTEEELLRALTSEAQRRAEPQPEDTDGLRGVGLARPAIRAF